MRLSSFVYVIFVLFGIIACRNTGNIEADNAVIDTFVNSPDSLSALPIDSNINIPADSIITPFGYTLLQRLKGNLDNDGGIEMVLVYNTNINGTDGSKRVLKIFNKHDSNWIETAVCTECVLPSESGGVLGDPFRSIAIKNNILYIEHFGGSREKWQYIHSYKLSKSGVAKLIGVKKILTNGNSINTIDANLSLGLVRVNEIEESETIKGKICRKNKFNKLIKIKNSDTVTFENMNPKWFIDFELPPQN